jgi:hypothetical protein
MGKARLLGGVLVSQLQPKIDAAILTSSRDVRKKLIKTAYLLAMDGMPLSKFNTMVNVQKANGLKIIVGFDSSKAAREFISCIATAIRGKLLSILDEATSFSIFTV